MCPYHWLENRAHDHAPNQERFIANDYDTGGQPSALTNFNTDFGNQMKRHTKVVSGWAHAVRLYQEIFIGRKDVYP